MVGAKVNGKLVPIDYLIQNGDRIEIITSQNSKGPSRDWLKIVKSTQAKNKINQWFRSELKEENILHGKELMQAYAKAKSINFSDINRPEYQEKIIRKYGFMTGIPVWLPLDMVVSKRDRSSTVCMRNIRRIM